MTDRKLNATIRGEEVIEAVPRMTCLASELNANHIGLTIRFCTRDPAREIDAVFTGELRQISHIGGQTTIFIGLGAEREHMLEPGHPIRLNPVADYSDHVSWRYDECK
jgi:hypothetical protein